MKKEEVNTIIKVSISIAALVVVSGIILKGPDLEIVDIIRTFSLGLTIATFFWGFYFKWGWKLSFLGRLINRPNINGTWGGELKSDWKDSSGNGVEPKLFFIVVRQTFLTISFTTFTDSFMASSYSEVFLLDKEKGISRVIYLYRKDTSDIGSKSDNQGATELRIFDLINNKMEGKYWTNIKTNGSIIVGKLSNDHIDSFEQGLALMGKL